MAQKNREIITLILLFIILAVTLISYVNIDCASVTASEWSIISDSVTFGGDIKNDQLKIVISSDGTTDVQQKINDEYRKTNYDNTTEIAINYVINGNNVYASNLSSDFDYKLKIDAGKFLINDTSTIVSRAFYYPSILDAQIEIIENIEYLSDTSYVDFTYVVKNLDSTQISDINLYIGGKTNFRMDEFPTVINGSYYDDIYNFGTSFYYESNNIVSTSMYAQTASNNMFIGDYSDYISIFEQGYDLVYDESTSDKTTGNGSMFMQWKQGSLNIGGTFTSKVSSHYDYTSTGAVILSQGTNTLSPSQKDYPIFFSVGKASNVYTASIQSYLGNDVQIIGEKQVKQTSDYIVNRYEAEVIAPELMHKPLVDIVSLTLEVDNGALNAANSCEIKYNINGSSPNINEMQLNYNYNEGKTHINEVVIKFLPVNIPNETLIDVLLLDENKNIQSSETGIKFEGEIVEVTLNNLNISTVGEESYFIQLQIAGYELIDVVLRIKNTPITSIIITDYPPTLYTGNSYQFKAQTMPLGAISSGVTWSIILDGATGSTIDSNTGVLSVGDDAGVVSVEASYSQTIDDVVSVIKASLDITINNSFNEFYVTNLPTIIDNKMYVERGAQYTFDFTAKMVDNDEIINIQDKDLTVELQGSSVTLNSLDKGVFDIHYSAMIGDEIKYKAYPTLNPELSVEYTFYVCENEKVSTFADNVSAFLGDDILFSDIPDIEQLALEYQALGNLSYIVNDDILLRYVKLTTLADNYSDYVDDIILTYENLLTDATTAKLISLNSNNNNVIVDYYNKIILKESDTSFVNALVDKLQTSIKVSVYALYEELQSQLSACDSLIKRAEDLFEKILIEGKIYLIYPNNYSADLSLLYNDMSSSSLNADQKTVIESEYVQLSTYRDMAASIESTISSINDQLDSINFLTDENKIINEGLIGKKYQIDSLITRLEVLNEESDYEIIDYFSNSKVLLYEALIAIDNLNIMITNVTQVYLSTFVGDYLFVNGVKEEIDLICDYLSFITSGDYLTEEQILKIIEIDSLIAVRYDAIQKEIIQLITETNILINSIDDIYTKYDSSDYDGIIENSKVLKSIVETYNNYGSYRKQLVSIMDFAKNTLIYNKAVSLQNSVDVALYDLKFYDNDGNIIEYVLVNLEAELLARKTSLSPISYTVEQQNLIIINIDLLVIKIAEINSDIAVIQLLIKEKIDLIFNDANYSANIRNYSALITDIELLLLSIPEDRWSEYSNQSNFIILDELLNGKDEEDSFIALQSELKIFTSVFYNGSIVLTDGLMDEKALISSYYVRINKLNETFYGYLVGDGYIAQLDELYAKIIELEEVVLGYLDKYINGGYIEVYDDYSYIVLNSNGLISLITTLKADTFAINQLVLNTEQKALAKIITEDIIEKLLSYAYDLENFIESFDTSKENEVYAFSIWVKENNDYVTDELGLWEHNKEGVYSIINSFHLLKTSYETNLNEEQLSLSQIYQNILSVINTYEILKTEEYEFIDKLNNSMFYNLSGSFNNDGMLSRENELLDLINECNSDYYTNEQKSCFSTQLGYLINIKNYIEDTKEINQDFIDIISENFSDNDLEGQITKDGLLSKSAGLETLYNSYNSAIFTNEQRTILINEYNGLIALLAEISLLTTTKSDFIVDVNNLYNVMEATNNYDGVLIEDNGILSSEEKLATLILRYNDLTIEIKSLSDIASVKIKIDGMSSVIDELYLEISTLENSATSYLRYKNDNYEGVIAEKEDIYDFINDLADTSKLTNQQIRLLADIKNELILIHEKAVELEEYVNKCIYNHNNNINYTPGNYLSGEIAFIENYLEELSLLTSEQQTLLSTVISETNTNLALIEARYELVDELYERGKSLNIWLNEESLIRDSKLVIDIDNDKYLSAYKDTQFKSSLDDLYSDLKSNLLTIEQISELNRLITAIELANELYSNVSEISSVVSQYNDLSLDFNHILISKQSQVQSLITIINTKDTAILNFLLVELDNLEEYKYQITIRQSQIDYLTARYNYILSYGTKIMTLGNHIDEFLNIYDGLVAFSEGNYITSEQKDSLSDYYSKIFYSKTLYNNLHETVNEIIYDYEKLNISVEDINIITKKTVINASLESFDSDDLNDEQKLFLSSLKTECLYLLNYIADVENQIQALKDKCNVYTSNTTSIISNQIYIISLVNSIENYSQQITNYCTYEISELNNLVVTIEELLFEVDEKKESIYELLTVLDENLIAQNALITSLVSWSFTATSEQKKIMEYELKLLTTINNNLSVQKELLASIISEFENFGSDINSSNEKDILDAITVYNGLSVIQTNYVNIYVSDKIIATVEKLQEYYLTDSENDLLIQIDYYDINKLIVLTSTNIDRDVALYSSYENLIITAKIGGSIDYLYKLSLTINKIDYDYNEEMTIRFKLPEDYNEDHLLAMINDDGNIEIIEFVLEDGYAIFTTNNLGHLTIINSNKEFPYLVLLFILIIIAFVCILIYFILRTILKANFKIEYDDDKVKLTILTPMKQIKNLGIYVDDKLTYVDDSPKALYMFKGLQVGSKISIFYDFHNFQSEFPDQLRNAPALRCVSKKIKI